MNHPGRMRDSDGGTHLPHPPNTLIERQPARRLYLGVERSTFEVLHHDVGADFRGHPVVIDRDDPRMLEPRNCERLTLEPFDRNRVRENVAAHDLHGHGALEVQLRRPIYRSHRPSTELNVDAELPLDRRTEQWVERDQPYSAIRTHVRRTVVPLQTRGTLAHSGTRFQAVFDTRLPSVLFGQGA